MPSYPSQAQHFSSFLGTGSGSSSTSGRYLGLQTLLLSGVNPCIGNDANCILTGTEGHFYRMFNPYAYPFHEWLHQNYGRVARIYGFFGVRLDPRILSGPIINTNRTSRTYNLWYLIRKPVITSLLKINTSSKRLSPSLSTFLFPDASTGTTLYNTSSANRQSFGPALFATSGSHLGL